MRILGGILAGDLLFVVLSAAMLELLKRGPQPAGGTQFLAATAALGALFALAAGYLAATIARKSPVLAGLGVAILITLGPLALVVISRPGAVWPQIAAFVLLALAALAGAVVRSRTHPERAA
ncbi:MAG TPA: hypothetical protein VE998_03535 [Terriglobales bacterium]|nr:hypothetical protein [Terriglobales bacterium]